MAKVHFENVSIEISSIPNQQNKNFFLSDYEKSIFKFLSEWLNRQKSWLSNTSGSTGKPKVISLNRDLMTYSANQTITALNLKQNNNCLLAINGEFVGGKMMITRCLENDMNLIVRHPSTKTLLNIRQDLPIDFAAFVPMQILSFLNDDEQRRSLNKINKVIIGGAPLSKEAIKDLQEFDTIFWQTYGMTETYSHVALKQINGEEKSEHFKATGDIEFSTDSENRLLLKGTITNHETLRTNDIVQLHDEKTFSWVGRYDHIINSGGIKISPEIIEDKLTSIFQHLFGNNNFFIASKPDKVLGEKVVLYVEGSIETELLKKEMISVLGKYEIPREVIQKQHFTYTQTGKINRGISAQE